MVSPELTKDTTAKIENRNLGSIFSQKLLLYVTTIMETFHFILFIHMSNIRLFKLYNVLGGSSVLKQYKHNSPSLAEKLTVPEPVFYWLTLNSPYSLSEHTGPRDCTANQSRVSGPPRPITDQRWCQIRISNIWHVGGMFPWKLKFKYLRIPSYHHCGRAPYARSWFHLC